ncbi:MAG: indole-3-glycerol phosphate synthase TrpC [Spirochaetes bacterium]|nr:indole-3-glycerol phosphate synthase TrpC [Spirochaetota bacterium]
MPDFLTRIVASKKRALDARMAAVPLAELRKRAVPRAGDRFRSLFRTAASGVILIAEIKKASPSKGIIAHHFDPVASARAYTDGHADAMSILTEEEYFQGNIDYIAQARGVSPLPILRKDFIIDEYQIYETAATPADTFLLITSLFDVPALKRMLELAATFMMTPLVEVHTSAERDAALEAGASIIGINNRNLVDFTIDLDTTVSIMKDMPRDRFVVAESGITTRDDVARLTASGVHGILVGEALMRSSSVGSTIRELKGV